VGKLPKKTVQTNAKKSMFFADIGGAGALRRPAAAARRPYLDGEAVQFRKENHAIFDRLTPGMAGPPPVCQQNGRGRGELREAGSLLELNRLAPGWQRHLPFLNANEPGCVLSCVQRGQKQNFLGNQRFGGANLTGKETKL
jgi:hypothetical protein